MPILESVLTDAHLRGQIRVFGPQTPNLPQMDFLDPDFWPLCTINQAKGNLIFLFD